MKLFQIEEPDGSPVDSDMPGAAIGIDLSGAEVAVALSVGGNAVTLADREGFELSLPVPALAEGDWEHVLVGARLRAERALARPVTHAVVVLGTGIPEQPVRHAVASAGLTLLSLVRAGELKGGDPAVNSAAELAEDLAPRPEEI